MTSSSAPTSEASDTPRPLTSRRAQALTGSVRVPGDKSISHRALMLGGVAVGETRISGLLLGEDVLATARAMRAYGVDIALDDDGGAVVHGVGVGGLREPDQVLDMGNAGTGARLLMGLAATHPVVSVFTGDASLRRRPMARVTAPLSRMGARFVTREGGRLPATVEGARDPLPIDYELPVASAQVKSAILLAGLNTGGATSVTEPRPTRDHTELMLRHLGAELEVENLPGGGRMVTVHGWAELTGRPVRVPADPSSAAFPLVAALLVPDSAVTLTEVGMNPLRTGLLDSLKEMGADLQITNRRSEAGEPVADLTVRHGPLRGVTIPPERAPTMIDEYPILAVAAAFAEGTTTLLGIKELTVKESDRLNGMARGLAACGVSVAADADSLTIHGTGHPPAGGATIATELDHRMAMAFLVLGMASTEPVTVDDARPVNTSFPGFVPLMQGLGAIFSETV